ncbi:DUF302 domain-containing protein [Effusibacillus lacus]|uniref:DUF302 domain-containing protein n=1 Tax=Effusibacillus lacus TaxID=1348429 RepID=A0A292YLQ3_9BACL|nr:DUF302 domain-containing protein [Effusibacillus lacus]TCS71211.1 uncharacterized protein (DUF302 family) [Effusibacillus lacus]GAX89839.1 hypothetical protein EFBL_1464 [Effusibacillus lacus]
MFHYSVETDKSVDEAVAALEESLKDRKFGVLWKLDIPAKLQEKGVDFTSPYRVLEVCNPHEAKRVLSRNKLVGYFLPCKIVVYEDQGKTMIGLPRPTMLMDVVNDPGLKEIAQSVEETLIEAVNAAK